MVTYQLTGEQARVVLAANQRAGIARVVNDSTTESLTFVVRSLADVKAVAAYLGIEVPQGRGRFPMNRLEDQLSLMGHKLDRSAYGQTETTTGTYNVALMEVSGDKVFPRSGVVSADQVRQFAHEGKGRPSKDAIASAAISVHGWGDTYLADSVKAERLD